MRGELSKQGKLCVGGVYILWGKTGCCCRGSGSSPATVGTAVQLRTSGARRRRPGPHRTEQEWWMGQPGQLITLAPHPHHRKLLLDKKLLQNGGRAATASDGEVHRRAGARQTCKQRHVRRAQVSHPAQFHLLGPGWAAARGGKPASGRNSGHTHLIPCARCSVGLQGPAPRCR